MPDDNRFFKYLWRFNAILIALSITGLLLLTGGMALGSLLWRAAYAPPADDRPAVVAKPTPDYSYDFGGTFNTSDDNLGGTLTLADGLHEAVMVLQRIPKNPYDAGSFSREGRSAENVNILLIDPVTARMHWLFAGVDRIIRQSMLVRAQKPAPQNQDNPVVALLMIVSDRDSNHDGELNYRDDQQLYVYQPGTPTAQRLFSARRISNVVQVDSGHVLVTYYDGKTDRVVVYATADFKPVAQNVIAATPR